jgi:hypothetical protein
MDEELFDVISGFEAPTGPVHNVKITHGVNTLY